MRLGGSPQSAQLIVGASAALEKTDLHLMLSLTTSGHGQQRLRTFLQTRGADGSCWWRRAASTRWSTSSRNQDCRRCSSGSRRKVRLPTTSMSTTPAGHGRQPSTSCAAAAVALSRFQSADGCRRLVPRWPHHDHWS